MFLTVLWICVVFGFAGKFEEEEFFIIFLLSSFRVVVFGKNSVLRDYRIGIYVLQSIKTGKERRRLSKVRAIV